MRKIVLHLKRGDIGRDLKGWHLEFYRVFKPMAHDKGIAFEIRARDADIKVGTRSTKDARFADGNLHIIDDRSVQMPNVLNAGVAYFWRFWHLDPHGVKAFSSIGKETYDPKMIAEKRAKNFYRNMQGRYVDTRRSKYGQPDCVQEFPDNSLAVFFQGDYPVASGATTIDDLEMLRIVQEEAGNRSIIVKPHPKSTSSNDRARLTKRAQIDDRIIITDANVHDILRHCSATVSINSTVALEGFLHSKPAILFGKSDFHHFTGYANSRDSFSAALDRELHRRDGFDRYLGWYFLKNCLSLNNKKLEAKIWERCAAAGFDWRD